MVSTTSVLFVSPLLWEWHKTLIPALNDAAEKRKQGRRPFERKKWRGWKEGRYKNRKR